VNYAKVDGKATCQNSGVGGIDDAKVNRENPR
jgi:hypothetical protein